MYNRQEGFDADGQIDPFVIEAPVIPVSAEGQAAKEIFDGNPGAEGIVVLEGQRPAGLIMRTSFFQKMGTLYGHSLYMTRSVRLVMESGMTLADMGESISRVGQQIMNRDQNNLYDYIVVNRNGSYQGVISIRHFLVELSKRNEAQISVLKTQQKQLIQAREQETALMRDLEYQTASIRNLLDHADQGFLSFGGDYTVRMEYSYKCVSIFGEGVGGKHYLELMRGCFEKERAEVFPAVLESYFKNNSAVTDTVYLMLLPADCVIGGRSIHFEYRRIEMGGRKAVMVILNDITERVEMERALESDRVKQRLIVKALSCQPQLRRMLEEFRQLFAGGWRDLLDLSSPASPGMNELYRAVHTFKGDFAQFGMMQASEALHGMESELFALSSGEAPAGLSQVEAVMGRTDPQTMLAGDLAVIADALGADFLERSEQIGISRRKLALLEEAVRSRTSPMPPQEAMELLRSLTFRSLRAMLLEHQDYLEYLAGRLMKSVPLFLVEGDDPELDPQVFDPLLRSLVHLFRNVMDHGIEPDEDRLLAGKPERGTVVCRISLPGDGRFTLRIADDGRGLDLIKLKERALEKGLYNADELRAMNDGQAAELIFADSLSTKQSADSLSGRGVGMSAVREACRRLGGDLSVESSPGNGTAFILTLPLTHQTSGETEYVD